MLSRLLALVRRVAARSKSPALAVAGAYWEYRKFLRWLEMSHPPAPRFERAKHYVGNLEKDGIYVLEDYWDREKCAAACEEVDRLIYEYSGYLHSNAKADLRIYGANNASAVIDEFSQDPILREVACAYSREPARTAFTLAAKMPASASNEGSGEGWHRDAFLRQFKAILYLVDVGLDNGPFQLVKESHRAKQVLQDIWSGRLHYEQYRFSELQVKRILKRSPGRLTTYTAKAGTVILVDTSSIHRGLPINTGVRYALTNYCFPERLIDAALFEKFKVLPAADYEVSS
ncbi:MAG: phytanoyl-CoA dioxygenase family protein [Nitrospira sp.]|jgi:hypothetical protein|nr:phytanoyl-CoA dioxygenase family protein [Nitrospira sp.]